MDSFHSETQQNHYRPQANQSSSNNKKRLTQEQVRVLERSFSANKKLVPDLKLELARRLGLPPRQVAVWFQNKRARWKAQTLELDHNTLQLKLDHAAAERRRLQREVARLGHELARAHEMIQLALVTGPPPPPTSSSDHLAGNPESRPIVDAQGNSCSSSSDRQWGSSASMDNIHNGDEVLQIDEDELYASFMMGGGDGSGSTSSWD